MSKNCDLSVIIITRNEEEIIGQCIESVISALNYAKEMGVLKTSEIILSDSASNDNTINIANQYPIKIVQLHKDWPLSAAAGLYIGFKYSKGKLVSVTGGDLIVDKEWYANAIPIFNKDESIAAVAGFCLEEFREENYMSKLWKEASRNVPVGEVDIISSGIFRKKLVEDVGSYNPYLKAGEDRDLSYRLAIKGYKLIRIPVVESRHFYEGLHGKMTYINNLKILFRYSVGDGHAARYHLMNKKIFFMLLSRYINVGFLTNYILIFIIINYMYLHMKVKSDIISNFFDIVIILSILIIILARLIKKKYDVFYNFLDRTFYMFTRQLGFLIGFIKTTKDPSKYPTNIKIIKKLN